MKKLNEKLENIANDVGVAAHSDPQTNKTTKFNCRGGRLCPPANKQNGITLIALIITIIVMLILVGVTINVALNGGLFGKAKKGTYQTETSMIKEQLEIAKAIKIDNNGKIPEDYGITIEKLDISDNLKSKYGTKLVISSDGILYYLDAATNAEEQSWLEEIGIDKYLEQVPTEPPAKEGYSFTIADLMAKEGSIKVEILEPHGIAVPYENFWAGYSGPNKEDLKNNIFNYLDYNMYKNMTCSSSNMNSVVDLISGSSGSDEAEYTYGVMIINFEEDAEDLPAGNYILLTLGTGDGGGFSKEQFNEVVNTYYNNVTFTIYAD